MAGLSGGGGESYTGSADDANSGDGGDVVDGGTVNLADALEEAEQASEPDPAPDPEPTTPAGPGLDPGAGGGSSGGSSGRRSSGGSSPSPDPEPTTPAGPGLDPGVGGSRQSGRSSANDDAPGPEPDRRNVSDQAEPSQPAQNTEPNPPQAGNGTSEGLPESGALNRELQREQRRESQARQTAQNIRNIGGDASVTDGSAIRIQATRNQRVEQARQTAQNLRDIGADASVDEDAAVRIRTDRAPTRSEELENQRDEFREEAAEEFDTPEENVDISFNEETNQFRAEQDLSDDQLRIDRATGGRFEAAVDVGRSTREATADVVSGPANTAANAATLPGRLVGGAAIRGVEAGTGVDVSEVDTPDFSAEQALALGTAGVVAPEPATSISGGVLAGGAALALGASALSNRNEVDVPQDGGTLTTELDVGENNADVTEIEPGAGRVSEIEPSSPFAEAEVETPTNADSSEVGVVDTTTLQQQQRGDLVEEQDPRQINPEDVRDPFDDVEQDPPSTRERQRRDDLDVFERGFPTGERSVIGRNTGQDTVDAVEEAQRPTFEQNNQNTTVGSGSSSGVVPGLGSGAGPAGLEQPLSNVGAQSQVNTQISTQIGDLFGTPPSSNVESTANPVSNEFAQPNQNVFNQQFGGRGSAGPQRPNLGLPPLDDTEPQQPDPSFSGESDEVIFEFDNPLGPFDDRDADEDDDGFNFGLGGL